MTSPKVLLLDIETSPIISYTWGIWDQNVGINQIKEDWYILSWAAKWKGESKIMQMDVRKGLRSSEKPILQKMWVLLDEADIVVTQNGVSFDEKKLNARFVFHGMQPPRPYKSADTKLMAKKKFSFTSNKLEYMAEHLNLKHKKLKHSKFEGFDLWKQCLAGNKAAWDEMAVYNKFDVLALEDLYDRLAPWSSTLNYSVYGPNTACPCGGKEFVKRGFYFTASAKYQCYRCKKCGAQVRDSKNLLEHKPRKGIA